MNDKDGLPDTIGTKQIITVRKPKGISMPDWDWEAWVEGDKDKPGLIGYGPTKEAAVDDLVLIHDMKQTFRHIEKIKAYDAKKQKKLARTGG